MHSTSVEIMQFVCSITRPPSIRRKFVVLKPGGRCGRCHIMTKHLLDHLSFLVREDSGLATSPCCMCAVARLDCLYTSYHPLNQLDDFY